MYFILLLVLNILHLTFITAENPVINTTHGKVKGKVFKTLLREQEYYGFMGIPFAKPPVNDLKYLPPQSVEPWNNVLNATKEKPACIQYNTNYIKGQSFGVFGSEDCLYLDIYTPKIDSEKRSVIVFFYNAHFSTSYNKTKEYAHDFFIEEDVVVVTISYRLSLLGFLNLENDVVPGNAGLKDIVSGLKWAKDNILKFGGDPDKITLMGVSGGAAAVDLLMYTKAKNLFRSVILQSGTAWSTAYLQEDVRDRAFKLAEMLDRQTSSNTVLLNDLRELSIIELLSKEIHANPQDYFKENQKGTLTFGPVVEKHKNGLLTQYPEDVHERINMPIMIGFNSREGLFASAQYLAEPRYLTFVQKDFPFLMPVRLRFKFNPYDDSYYDAADEIKKFYFKKGRVTIKSVEDHITYLGDVVTSYAVDYNARKSSQRSNENIYYYYFDYSSDLNENKNHLMKLSKVQDGIWGAAAGDELCYLFYCPDLKDKYLKHNKTNSEEIITLRKMVRMWTNFAKYGNPTPEGDDILEDLKWPTFNNNTKEYLHIDKKFEVKAEPCKKRFQFWDETLDKWEKRAVNGTVPNKNKRDEL